MKTQRQLLDAWLQRKSSGPFFRLRETKLVEFEYKGPRFGHPSNYAKVRFQCDPGDELRLAARIDWPVGLPPDYCDALVMAIGNGVVEAAMGQEYPYRGCTMTLIAISWDDVSSSELAFYRAAKAATEDLVRMRAEWVYVRPAE